MTDKPDSRLRREIIDACLKMNELGINQGTSGNISARSGSKKRGGGMLITPSSIPYEQLRTRDVVHLDIEGTQVGDQNPSSEWRFHRDIYKHRPEARAVVHTHSMYATIVSICRESIPAVHYMVALAGGGPDIRCAEYATFGTQELSDNALGALEDRKSCLLANHGVIAMGDDVEHALWRAKEVEVLAQQYVTTQMLGKGHVLPDDEIERVRISAAEYGLRAKGKRGKPIPKAAQGRKK